MKTGLSEDSRFKLHGVYRHFKGGYYLLEDVIYHSETGEKMVAYRALYGEGRLWCRPYEEFFSEVDAEKYPRRRAEVEVCAGGRGLKGFSLPGAFLAFFVFLLIFSGYTTCRVIV